MKNNDIDTIWVDIESHTSTSEHFFQRLVYVDLLYRSYIGATGIPARRFLSIEIPENEANKFDSFVVPRGFTLTINSPGVKHDGYVACILQATSADQNDVFTIVAKDIMEDLRQQKEANLYIESLKRRIEKWKVFFTNPENNRLSEKMVIGLFGELSFIKELHECEIDIASDLWNGPLKSSQDFQGNKIATEVKTSVANSLECVHISSELQLDDADREELFLVGYRIERNDASGITLYELINQVADMLTEQQKARFIANLICIGYSNEDNRFYNKRYCVKERKSYRICEGFPRIIRADLPQGITEVNYKLLLQSCSDFEIDFETIVQSIRECEYGES